MPNTVFSLVEYSAFNSMKSKNTTNHELTTKATNSFNHKLTMFFMPGNWQFSCHYFLKTCCHSVLSLTTILAETFNPG